MFGTVQTPLNGTTVTRFCNSIVGTGKTYGMLLHVKDILSKGQTCLLITPSTYLVKEYFPDHRLPEGLSVLHIDKYLKYLKRYNPDEHPENEWIQKDYLNLFKSFVEPFNGYDRVVVDPDCYIKIMQQLVERLDKIETVCSDLHKVWEK